MLGWLEVTPSSETRPRLTGHPFLTVLVSSALGALERPAQVSAELDWLGECAWIHVSSDQDQERHRLRLGDAAFAGPGLSVRTATTGLSWRRGTPWVDAWVGRLVQRLRRRERRSADLWARNRESAATGVLFEYRPGEPAVARPF